MDEQKCSSDYLSEQAQAAPARHRQGFEGQAMAARMQMHEESLHNPEMPYQIPSEAEMESRRRMWHMMEADDRHAMPGGSTFDKERGDL